MLPNSINVDGVEYQQIGTPGRRAVVVVDRGWIFAIAILILFATATGCRSIGSLSRVLFTAETVADVELEGSAGQCVPIAASIAGAASPDPRAAALLATLGTFGDPIGCMLQVERVGGGPFFVLCSAQGGMERTCRALPLNGRVRVSGSPIGPGGVLIPTRVRLLGGGA